MKLRTLLLLFTLLTFVITGCGVTSGSEPAASDDPPVGLEEEPTADPEQPVSSDDPPPTAEPTTGAAQLIIDEARVSDIQIMMLESFPVQVRVQVRGELGDGCTELGAVSSERQGDTFFVTINTERPAEAICTQQLKTFEELVALDVAGLEAGTYTVNVNGVTDTFALQSDNSLPGQETGDAADLSQEDLAELIRLTLERALIEQEIPDYQLLVQDRDEIVLSSEKIHADLVPALSGVNLVVLSPTDIQTQANEEGDFPYLRFQEITADSATSATVSLGSVWARAEDSDMLYLSGGGFTIEYTKEAGQWSGEVVERWIS